MSYNFPLPPLYGLNFHPNDENGNVFGGFFPGRFPLPVIVQAPSSSGTFDSGSPPTSPSGSSELEEEDEEDDEEEEEDEEEGYSSEDQRSASEHGAPSSDRVSRSGPTSPQQPSTPDSAESYLAHYAANLPPSPIRHHYAGSFYPGQAMVQTRSSSRTYDQPPNAAQSARAGASSSRAGAEAPPSGATAGGSGGGGGGASRTGRLPPGAPPSQPTRRAQPTQTSRRSQSRQPPPMIDLTLSSPSGPSTTTAKRSAAQGPARKKQKTSKALKKLSEDEREDEGENDADDDDDDADTEDDGFTMIPIEKPPAEDEKPKKLAGTACIICMEDEPVDLSITPCGHMFCNKCLFGAIKSTLPAPQKVHGKCPVCRGKVAIKDIIVLEIKKRSKGKDRA